MADDVEVSYRLPTSCIRFTGTTQYTVDQVLAPSEERVAYAAAIELDAIADTDRLFTLTVDRVAALPATVSGSLE